MANKVTNHSPHQAPRSIAPAQKNSLGKRLGWLALIWLASVAALGLASLLIKLLMKMAGFNS